jgi:hypothetical protein
VVYENDTIIGGIILKWIVIKEAELISADLTKRIFVIKDVKYFVFS